MSKTRLAEKFGQQGAANAAKAFLEDTIRVASRVAGARVVLSTTDVRADFGDVGGLERLDQGAGTLGDRLERVLRDQLERGPWAMALGADSPGLPEVRLQQAIEIASAGRAALGPTEDGGFYLLALPRCPEGLLQGIPWSTPETREYTWRALVSAGLEPVLLQPWFDIDWPDDLARFLDRVDPELAPSSVEVARLLIHSEAGGGVQHEALPTWLAYPAARIADADGRPGFDDVRSLIQAWMEWSTVLLLADHYDRDAELDLELETAMRMAMTRPMGFEGWRAVFDALLDSERTGHLMGVAGRDEVPADHPVAAAIWAATGDPDARVDLRHLVWAISDTQPVREDAIPTLLAAAEALLAASATLRDFTLVDVVELTGRSDGTFVVRHRAFKGTAWPSVREVVVASLPPLAAGERVFWDGGSRVVKVPDWLVHIVPESFDIALYDGREPETRHWLYRQARPGSDVVRLSSLHSGAPVVLAEPTWRTPAPARRRVTPQPSTLRRAQTPSPVARPGPSAGSTGRYLLTVLAGRSYLRSCELADEDSVVMGRNPAFASFVIHHHEVSRSNTRVWTAANGDLYVQDLRSTNGTQLDGEVVGNAPVRVGVGQVISVGPVPVGVSAWSADEASRLRRVVGSPGDSGRDPLTGLYTPTWLAEHSERATGVGFTQPLEQVALYVAVDRLGALHAQQGAELADTVFQNVARALSSRLPAPGAAVRVGYGEILAILGEGGELAARALADELVGWCADHRWLPGSPGGVRLLSAVVRGEPGKSVDDWLVEARTSVHEGRGDKARGRPG